jgi:hypothetical protein
MTIQKPYVYLRYNWISTSERLQAVAATLAEQCRVSRGSGVRQVRTNFVPAFNVVLTALEVSDAYKPNQWIRIVTDDEVYGGKTQRSAAHNRQVLTALEWLIGGGYLLKVDGKRQVKVDGSSKVHDLPFAYVITDKWREEITDQPISLQHEIVRNPLASYVQLRTKTKDRSVALPITQADRQHYPDLIGGSERLLESSDAIWQRVKISLGGDVLPPMQTTMTRIFNNGSFEQGGRFYCQLQNLPKKQRINLRFDDEPTIEIDYSGMHPHLLYHLQRNEFSGDPYDIEGFKREAVKVAFNTLINRDSSKHKGTAAKSLVRNLNITMVQAMSLENAIYRLHHRIAGHFNTGYGLKLQKLDSQIAYDVMTHFFMEIKRPILMIHDSAIVSVRDVEALKLCMADSYRSTVFNELQKLGHSNEEDAPLPKGLKVSSDDFNSTLTNTIYKALEGIDVNADEWSMQ